VLSGTESKLIHGLQRRKMRESQGFFLAEGVRVAEELAASDVDLHLAVVTTSLGDNPRGAALRRALEGRCATREVGEHELEKLAATDQPQGVLVVGRTPAARLDRVQLETRALLLIADAVQDPGNLGTLIRIADAFAAAAVLTLPGTVDLWNPKVVRAGAGSSFHLPLIAADHDAVREWLQKNEFEVVGAAAEGEPAEGKQYERRIALIVGNEGAGLSAPARSLVTRLVSVPMPGRAESLNVAVASGILMYILARR
jgi:RNA methyltransferase, TrmH family